MLNVGYAQDDVVPLLVINVHVLLEVTKMHVAIAMLQARNDDAQRALCYLVGLVSNKGAADIKRIIVQARKRTSW